jgi:hypothetical protein
MDKQLLVQFFIVLMLAHLITDFILKPYLASKNKKGWLWRGLSSLIDALFAYAFLTKWNLWFVPLIIGVSDYLIDWGHDSPKTKGLSPFLLDQGAHFLVLTGLCFWIALISPFSPLWINWLAPYIWKLIILACTWILLVPCGGTVIGFFMDPIQKQIGAPAKGLREGGKIIGYLERLLILTFVVTNQVAGIGFLVAAKSIFRFSEIKKSDDRKEAEYIIIGTFLSFLYAIVISYLAVKMMG